MGHKQADRAVIEALQHNLRLYKAIHTPDRVRTLEGHWINEAYVVRVCAILEAHGIFSQEKSIDETLPGSKDVDLCRRLRNKIAHATGEVRNRKAEVLHGKVLSHYGITNDPPLFRGKFRLPKDKVLRPMLQACLTYCHALFEKESE